MSWTPLCGIDDQPFKGNPDALQGAANSMSTIARQLGEQATLLQGYVNDSGSWTGDAKDAFAKTIGGLPQQLSNAHSKYLGAANALSPYTTTLRDAQQRAEALRAQAEEAQNRINRYTHDLGIEQQWKRDESQRATHAQADPAYGSPVAREWSGANNSVLLRNARQDLATAQSQFHQLRSHVDAAATTASNGIKTAAEIVHDDGGPLGWVKHRGADVTRVAKWTVAELNERGVSLTAISATLTELAGWLAIISFIPIPFVQQVFQAIAFAVTVTSLLVNGILTLAGEDGYSWNGYALGVGLALLPFAGKALRARAVTGAAFKQLPKSAIARNLSNVSMDKQAMIKNSRTLFKDADHFKTTLATNRKLDFLRIPRSAISQKPLNVFGPKVLYSTFGLNSATSVINMSYAGKVGTAARITTRADEFARFVQGARSIPPVREGSDELARRVTQ